MGQLFFYNNLFKPGIITASSQSAFFPASNVLTRWPSECWRSNSGAGSGWGNFVITASVNDRLDFNEGAAALAALLTPGTYTADSFCTHLKTQMEAVGAGTYTWTYGESGTYANKFRVVKSAGTLNLLLNTGVNKARSVASAIGFADTADRTGALSYYADNIRIHTEEWLKFDLGSTLNVYGVFIKNHNFQAGATVLAILYSTAGWESPILSQPLTVQPDITGYVWSSPQSCRSICIYVNDASNPDGYIKIGVAWAGGRFAPVRNRLPEYDYQTQDPSLIKYSSGGQISAVLKDQFKIRNFAYQASPDIADFETMISGIGFVKELFLVEDSAAPLTTSRYAKLNSYHTTHFVADLWDIEIAIEDLR